jgi:hypothetical protein
LWELYYRRETAPSYQGAFWYCGEPITPEEIQQALDAKNFNFNEENCGQYPGNRGWHIRQIATFVNVLKNGGSFAPILLDCDDALKNGCHRLYAHWYLDLDGTALIEVTYESNQVC